MENVNCFNLYNTVFPSSGAWEKKNQRENMLCVFYEGKVKAMAYF